MIEGPGERNNPTKADASVGGLQSGDPAKLAQALMTLVDQEPPPLRFIAGADAIETAEQVVATLQQQIDALRNLSTSLEQFQSALNQLKVGIANLDPDTLQSSLTVVMGATDQMARATANIEALRAKYNLAC